VGIDLNEAAKLTNQFVDAFDNLRRSKTLIP